MHLLEKKSGKTSKKKNIEKEKLTLLLFLISIKYLFKYYLNII